LVSQRLRRPFRDSDAEIEAKTGKTVPEIFGERGEAAFRAEEKMVLAAALCCDVPSVIAVAGGAVLDPESRRRIRRGGVVIWLRAAPETLAERVGAGRGRPLLEHDPVAMLRHLDALRRPVYAGIADGIVDVDGMMPVGNAERVARLARNLLGNSSIRCTDDPSRTAT
ncbi:MAG: shikimate kinase, partial [Acidimicrobiales bacterium]